MSKSIGPVQFGSGPAIVVDPIQSPFYPETFFTHDWFGADAEVKWLQPMQVVGINFRAEANPQTTGNTSFEGMDKRVILVAYDEAGNEIGRQTGWDGKGRHCGFYYSPDGKPNPQFESQKSKMVRAPIVSMRLTSDPTLPTAFLYESGVTLAQYEQTQALIAADKVWQEEQKRLEEEEYATLIESLKQDHKISDWEIKNKANTLKKAKDYKVYLDTRRSLESGGASTEEADAKAIDAVLKAQEAARSTTEVLPDSPAYRFAYDPNNPNIGVRIGPDGVTPTGPLDPISGVGRSSDPSTGSSGGTSPTAVGGSNPAATSLISAFQNIYNPNDSELSGLQGKFAGAIQNYVEERTRLVNSADSALVAELRLIRMALEKLLGL